MEIQTGTEVSRSSNEAPWKSKSDMWRQQCQPPAPSLSWCPLMYPSSTSRNKPPELPHGGRQKGEAASANTAIMMVSHIVQGLAGDLRGGPLPKNKLSGLEQRVSAAAGRCVCRPPPRPPRKPQPRLSDVCVPSLMKKFWYLGETLLSAEQTLPPPCPQPLHCHTAAPPIRNSHQAFGFTSLAVNGISVCISYLSPPHFQHADNISGNKHANNWWLATYFLFVTIWQRLPLNLEATLVLHGSVLSDTFLHKFQHETRN